MLKNSFTFFCCLGLTFVALAAHPRYPDDAALRAVHFVDANEGWAAGDDGVIWHTIDGGAHWDRQATGVHASLRALCFLNPYTGWVVGRVEAAGGISVGVLLVTNDGGLSWRPIASNTLPGLHAVRFFNNQHGIVAGDSSDQFPSGVFVTVDGGQNWQPLAGARQPGWLTADFADLRTGAMAGTWGSAAHLRDGLRGVSGIDSAAGQSILGLKIAGKRAFAVGQGGLMLISEDAGEQWTDASNRLKNVMPKAVLRECDFTALCVLGEHIWIAGRPGSFVLHSRDYGLTWERFQTGQPLPLHAIHFHDARCGWAVGEMGLILRTDDGGKTWKVQRRGGVRAAALFLHSGPETLPLDVIGRLGGDDGYRIVALRTHRPDPATASFRYAADEQRWSDAVRRAGGVSGQVLRFAKTFDADEQIRQIVLALRIWQPEIVLCDERIDSVAAEAYRCAGDVERYPEHSQQLGLAPWNPKKRFSTVAAKSHAVTISVNEPLPRLGDSPRDLATEVAAIFPDDLGPWPPERKFYLHANRLSNGGTASLMDGILLAPGGTARRELTILTDSDAKRVDERIKGSQMRRNLEALAHSDFRAFGGPDRILGQLDASLKRMPPDQAAATAFALGRGFVHSGQWHMAREVFLLLVDRYPHAPRVFEALRWLAQYGASGEARRRHELGQFVVTTDFELRPAAVTNNDQEKPIQQTGAVEAVHRSQLGRLADQQEARRWNQATIALEPYAERYGKLFAQDPKLQFCIQAARRSLGNTAAAQRWFERFLAETGTARSEPRTDPWRELAALELWATNRTARAPRPVSTCRAARQKPHLDGKLDDECWSGGEAMSLQLPAGKPADQFGTAVRFAHDHEYLYVAVECSSGAASSTPKLTGRNHDMDVEKYDHVSILLDLDRDYQTYYRVQIDRRGGVADDCWGDKSWNPRWFVAVADTQSGWTAEAAIPLNELTGDKIGPGRAWACNVTRVVPGHCVSAWSMPASKTPTPEGMGLLVFEEKK